MKLKIFSTFLILGGLAVLMYPRYEDWQQMRQQKELLLLWQEQLSVIDQNPMEDGLEQEEIEELGSTQETLDQQSEQALREEINALNQEEKREAQRQLEKQQEEEAQRQQKRQEYIKNNMMGALEIDSIDLYLPILRGATEKNLNISLASLESDIENQDVQEHYIIAGHRSHTLGKNFNRLDELEKDDLISLQVKDGSYTYQVEEKLYVEPQDMYVLDTFYESDGEITLITCEPMINPTHRLIIKGKRIE